jgi:FkbM family methyltransferase
MSNEGWADRVDAAVVKRRPGPRHRMMPLLEAFASIREEAFFVQIGANDGEQQDPLRDLILRHRWAGIMVEPVPYVFERLRKNYSHLTRIKLENVAVGAEDGTVPFYHLAYTDDAGRPGLPSWFDALGSLNKDVVTAHKTFIPDIDDRLVETMVPSLTFDSLCRRHDVEAIDLLLTDTEGYDYEILRRIDFDRIRPKLIIYESWHLDEDDRKACAAHLSKFGYETIEYGLDTWCLNLGALSDTERRALVPIWRWASDAESRSELLPATQLLRSLGRRVFRHDGGGQHDG